MTKVTVILRCRHDNGKEVLPPGATVSMDKARAEKLAEMGLVKFVPPPVAATASTPSTAAKAAGKKKTAKAATPPQGEPEDTGDTGIPDPDELLNDPGEGE